MTPPRVALRALLSKHRCRMPPQSWPRGSPAAALASSSGLPCGTPPGLWCPAKETSCASFSLLPDGLQHLWTVIGPASGKPGDQPNTQARQWGQGFGRGGHAAKQRAGGLVEGGGRRPISVSSQADADVAEVVGRLRAELSDKRVDAAADLPRLAGFLLTMGLPKEDVVAAFVKSPALLRSHLDEDIRPKVDFLASHGVTQTQMASAMCKNPDFLRSRHMTRLVQSLFEWGLRQETLGRVVATYPQILALTEQNLASTVAFLRGPDVGVRDVARAIDKFPAILTLSLQSLATKCSSIKVLLPKANLAKLLSAQPRILSAPPETMGKKFASLGSMFEGTADIATLITAQPSLLGYSVDNMETNMRQFQALLGKAVALRMLQQIPQLLGLRWKANIQPKLAFLVDAIGLDVAEIVIFPPYLGYSLDARIKPRTAALLAKGYCFRKAHDKAGDMQKTVTLSQVILPTDTAFASKFLDGDGTPGSPLLGS